MSSTSTTTVGFIGLGYVGLAYALAFSLHGFRVIGVDISEKRLEEIKRGDIEGFPREAILEALKESLELTSDYSALRSADAVFITVNTPTREDWSQDLSQALSALEGLSRTWRSSPGGYRVVVVKSTVLPGTTRHLAKYAREVLGLPVPERVGFAHSPEFLRADRALEDVLRPSRVVIGGVDEKSSHYVYNLLRELYKRAGYEPPFFLVTPEEAELVKYASNTFLALKTVYGNLIGLLCRQIENCDAWRVMEIVGLDPRIGRSHIIPGTPYSGPCLVKDVSAFARFVLEKTGLDSVKRIHEYNELVVDKIVEDLEKRLRGLSDRRVAVLGVAYKPGSSEVRDSSAIVLSKKLLSRGAVVYIHDVNEKALRNAQNMLREVRTIEALEQLRSVDAVVVLAYYREYEDLLASVSDTSVLVLDVTGKIARSDAYKFYASSK